MTKKRNACIIGAGPAGLTAAYELVKTTAIIPLVVEKSSALGGLARTVNYKGNRIDIGGHRFFSKSDRVVKWWLAIMPVEGGADMQVDIMNHGAQHHVSGFDSGRAGHSDEIMLVRPRKSRIYYRGKLFDYPISMSIETLTRLGLVSIWRIIFSYLFIRLFPKRPEKNLEEFFINRFCF